MRGPVPQPHRHPNLLHSESLAGFRVGYAILPEALAEDLNRDNDAYPLAVPSQAAALATLTHYEEIRERAVLLRTWTEKLAAGLRDLGVRTFPTETYFFLADVSPLTAEHLAAYVHDRGILLRPLGDPQLGPGCLRVTTGRPEENQQFLAAVRDCLKEHGA